ncbi:MAG: amidotransferase 1, exosortase A system-associated [Rhodospirillales bacterium]|nr:MAG: amidotransferase 1, exosortase A system-associated [Rhodospirillales bacterium]
MCGFVGIFDCYGTRPIDRGLLRQMNDRLAHRGPDGDGLHVGPGLGLGHRRLAIIDLAGGHQPLYNEDGSVVVVYNGEIYNFHELADQLAQRGHTFRTRCDTEVIVHAWEEWGEACVERFRGMFAFALWDDHRQTLFLARDRLGKKPLYYSKLSDGTLIFASELKALLCHPGFSRDIDPLAVEDYFAYGYVPDPKTIYRTARKLAPGHRMCVTRGDGTVSPRRYWDVSFSGDMEGDEATLAAELVERLREAVRLRLIADVPLGAFLSGGVDSSAVVALMAGLSDSPVVTCSIGFGEPEYDESSHAALLAGRYGTQHNTREVNPADFDLLETLIDVYDEPFADSSALPTYQVCALGREHVTVALSGDGGDELFAGYRRHRWHHYEETVRARVPAPLRGVLFGMLGAAYPKADWAPKVLRAKATLEALARDSVGAYFHSVSVMPDRLRHRLLSSDLQQDLAGYHASEVLRYHMDRATAADPVARVQYADLMTYLPGDILTKVDRASMAHGLEVRVPILDHKFVEWGARLPAGLRLRGRAGKYLFKKSLEPLVPSSILYREKMGFAVPLAAWFRGPLRGRLRALLADSAVATSGMLDQAFVQRALQEHESGLRDHSSCLWSVLMFVSFLERVHRSAATVPAPPAPIETAAPARMVAV